MFVLEKFITSFVGKYVKPVNSDYNSFSFTDNGKTRYVTPYGNSYLLFSRNIQNNAKKQQMKIWITKSDCPQMLHSWESEGIDRRCTRIKLFLL